MRLGLVGEAYTCVDGEDISFRLGDLVLTPHDCWHNHDNRSSETNVNFTVLDMPLVNTLSATYFDFDTPAAVQAVDKPNDYSRWIYGKGGMRPRGKGRRGAATSSPQFVYRYDDMRELLSRLKDYGVDPHDGVTAEYIDPTSGASTFRTMTFFAQLLPSAFSSLPQRTNASLIITPLEGHGHTMVGAERFDWRRGELAPVLWTSS